MNKSLVKKIVYGVAAVCAVVALIMLVAPALSPKADYAEFIKGYTGAEIAFGKKESGLAFSFLYFLPYLLVIVGLVFTALAAFGKLGKAAPVVAVVCYIVAAVLFFLPVQALTLNVPAGTPKEFVDEAKKAITEYMQIGIGAILAAIMSIVAAVCTVVSAFVLKSE